MKPKVTKPLVSVLLPVFNAQKYLASAVQSILNQTEANFELICINDGSTDNSASILADFAKADSRIRILTNPKNIGMAASLNRALTLTRGKYIARMDADDISLPSRFEHQIELLESDKSLVAVGCQEEIINARGKITAQKFFPTNPNTCYQTLANFMPIQPPTLMIRGSVFRKIRYNVSICKNDDINIYFKLLQYGGFSNCPQILFQYRQIPTSLTHSNAKKVYFMALKNRLEGFFKYGYRPSLVRIGLFWLETLFITLIPSFAITPLFNLVRNQKPSASGLLLRLRPGFANFPLILFLLEAINRKS